MNNPHFKHRAKRGNTKAGTPFGSTKNYVGSGKGKAEVPPRVKGVNYGPAKGETEYGKLKLEKSTLEKIKKLEEQGYVFEEGDWATESGDVFNDKPGGDSVGEVVFHTPEEVQWAKHRERNRKTIERLQQKNLITPSHPSFHNYNRPYSKSEEMAPFVNSHSSVFAPNPPDPEPLRIQRPVENTSAITSIATGIGALAALNPAAAAVAATGAVAGGLVGSKIMADKKAMEKQADQEKLHHYFQSEPKVKQHTSAQGKALYQFLKQDNMSLDASIEKYKKENPAEWKNMEKYEPELYYLAKNEADVPAKPPTTLTPLGPDPPPPPPPDITSHGPDDKEDPPIKEDEKEEEKEESSSDEEEPEFKSMPGPNGQGLGPKAPVLSLPPASIVKPSLGYKPISPPSLPPIPPPAKEPHVHKPIQHHPLDPNATPIPSSKSEPPSTYNTLMKGSYEPIEDKTGKLIMPPHVSSSSIVKPSILHKSLNFPSFPNPEPHRHDQPPPPVGMGSDTTPKVKPNLITDTKPPGGEISTSTPAAASAAASAGPGAAAASGVVGKESNPNPMVDYNQMSMSENMPSQILAPSHSSSGPMSSSVLRSGFNIDDLGAEADSDLLLDRAKGDIRMRTIAQVSNATKKTKKEKLQVGEGETKNNWRFNGPYDSPPGITDPNYLKIQDMVAKKEGGLLEGGYIGVHKSLWKRTHTAKGVPMQQQSFYSYNHPKQMWKKINAAEKNRWQNKRSENIKNGMEMPGEIDAKKAKTLADVMNKKRKRIEECGCGPGKISAKKGIHKQM